MPNGLMPNAKQNVDESMVTLQNTILSLEESLRSAEKADNKVKIQAAITSLNDASQELSSYQD